MYSQAAEQTAALTGCLTNTTGTDEWLVGDHVALQEQALWHTNALCSARVKLLCHEFDVRMRVTESSKIPFTYEALFDVDLNYNFWSFCRRFFSGNCCVRLSDLKLTCSADENLPIVCQSGMRRIVCLGRVCLMAGPYCRVRGPKDVSVSQYPSSNQSPNKPPNQSASHHSVNAGPVYEHSVVISATNPHLTRLTIQHAFMPLVCNREFGKGIPPLSVLVVGGSRVKVTKGCTVLLHKTATYNKRSIHKLKHS